MHKIVLITFFFLFYQMRNFMVGSALVEAKFRNAPYAGRTIILSDMNFSIGSAPSTQNFSLKSKPWIRVVPF